MPDGHQLEQRGYIASRLFMHCSRREFTIGAQHDQSSEASDPRIILGKMILLGKSEKCLHYL